MAHVLDAGEYLDAVSQLLAQGHENVPVPVAGHSMTPFLHPGDQVFLSPIRREPRPGDVLLYRRASGQYVLHRLHRVTADGFLITGDAQTELELIPHRAQLLGIVTSAIHLGKPVSPEDGYWRLYAHLWRYLRPLRPVIVRVRGLLPSRKR